MATNASTTSVSTTRNYLVRVLACALSTLPLTGCLVVGGSSRGGFFLFPGSLGLIVLIVIVALVLRRR